MFRIALFEPVSINISKDPFNQPLLPNHFPLFHPQLHRVSTLLQILINTNSFPIYYGLNDPNIAKEVENPAQMVVLATIELFPTRICWECTIDPNRKIKLNPSFLFIAR
jgi:hypothetical protein